MKLVEYYHILKHLLINIFTLKSFTLLFGFSNFQFPDFDFSLSNQYIASSSEDKTVRVWDISKGLCIRVIYGVSAQLCIRFHPVCTPNSSLIWYLEMLNVSRICILSCLDGFISFQVNNNFLSAGNSNREINVMKYALYHIFLLALFLLCDMQYSFLVVFQLTFYFSNFYLYSIFLAQVLPLDHPSIL